MAINYHNHNINTSGTITSPSGNFTTLVVNGTSVSNFNSSVSGLLPTIANSGDNRVLTSTGSTLGINAEANLTFNGSLLNVVGSGSFSSQTVFASGTAAAPGISILGDTDTGLCQISSVGTNSLSISTSGVERVRFASNGDVQINTGRTISGGTGGALFGNNGINNDFVSTGRAAALSAAWATLRVNQVAAYVGLRLVGDTSQTASYMEVENSSGTNLFTINSAGNIGIGTSSPNAKLEIQGSSGVYTRLLTTSSSFYVVHNGTTDTFLYTQEASSLRIGTSATERLRITSGGNLEIKSNAGNISTLFTYNENGGELVHYDDAQAAATLLDQCNNSTRLLELINGSDLLLGLGGSNSTGSIRFMRAGFNEAMRIDSAGRVGIGLGGATPATAGSSALQVRGDLDIFGNNSDRSITYNVGVGDDGITGWYRGKIAFIPSSATNKISTHIAFFNKDGDNGGSTLTERMRITSDGNVGIGTTSPATRLHVAGTSSTFNGLLLTTTAAGGGVYASIDIGTYYGTWTNAPPASFRFIDDGNFSTHITFRTKNSGSASSTDTERMRITSGGSVGIGTDNPSYTLHLSKAGNHGLGITSTDTNGAQITLLSGSNSAQLAHSNNVTYLTNFTSGGAIAITQAGAGYISFSTNSNERFRIDSNGNASFGGANVAGGRYLDVVNVDATLNSSSIFRLITRNSTNTGNTTVDFVKYNSGAFYITNWEGPILLAPNGVVKLTINSDGSVVVPDVYADTVGATNRDLFIDNTGLIGYVSSIRSSKTEINNLDNVSWLKELNPVSYYYRKKDNDGNYTDEPDGNIDYGLIAEDVEVVAPELCFYDIIDDNPELRGVHYSKLITPMLKYIQQLEDRIASLETRLGDNV